MTNPDFIFIPENAERLAFTLESNPVDGGWNEEAAATIRALMNRAAAAWNEGYNARCDDENGNPEVQACNPYQRTDR